MISDLSLFRLIKHSKFALLIYQFHPGEKNIYKEPIMKKKIMPPIKLDVEHLITV